MLQYLPEHKKWILFPIERGIYNLEIDGIKDTLIVTDHHKLEAAMSDHPPYLVNMESNYTLDPVGWLANHRADMVLIGINQRTKVSLMYKVIKQSKYFDELDKSITDLENF